MITGTSFKWQQDCQPKACFILMFSFFFNSMLGLIDAIIWVRKLKTEPMFRGFTEQILLRHKCEKEVLFSTCSVCPCANQLDGYALPFFSSWPCFCPYSYRTGVQVGCQWATQGCIDWQRRQVCIRSNSGVQRHLILSVSSPPLLLPKTALQSANCTLSDIQVLYFRGLVRTGHFYPRIRSQGVYGILYNMHKSISIYSLDSYIPLSNLIITNM